MSNFVKATSYSTPTPPIEPQLTAIIHKYKEIHTMSEIFRHSTDNNFKADVLEHKGLVLVHFVDEGSPSCNSLEAALKQVTPAYNPKARFVKMDIKETPGITEKYGVDHVPTVMLFSNGEEVAREVGPLSVERVTWLLDSVE